MIRKFALFALVLLGHPCSFHGCLFRRLFAKPGSGGSYIHENYDKDYLLLDEDHDLNKDNLLSN